MRAIASALALALLACAASESPSVYLPPGTSVVMITIDTLRADHLSRNGHRNVTTPYFDALAREGVYCARSYAQGSWTLPSMLSMFSSLSPPVFGVTEGVKPAPKPGRPDREPTDEHEVIVEYFSEAYTTLPEVLAANGFTTAGFSTNGHLIREQGFDQGFDHFDQTTCMWRNAGCAFGSARRWLAGHLAQPQEMPFFLWIHLFDPHFDERFRASERGAPIYRPEPGYDGLFAEASAGSIEESTRRDYDRKLRYTDDQLRDFVEALRAGGLLERSLLVIVADHGEEFNEQGLWGHSKSVRNTLVHVPLFFRFPGEALRGEVEAVVRNIDIAPTVLDWLELRKPVEMEGHSLLPLFRGDEAPGATAYGETRRFERDLRYRIDPDLDRKLVLDLNSGRRELYSLSEDPDERTDLAAIEPARADAMERSLRAAIEEMESRAAGTRRSGTLSDEEFQNLRRLGYVD